MEQLSLEQFKKYVEEGATVIDTRASDLTYEGIIENSILILPDENFIFSLTQYTDEDAKLLFVTSDSDALHLARLLKNAGTFHVLGRLNDSLEAWKKAEYGIDFIIGIQPDELEMDYQYDEFFLIDTRTAEEFAQEHLEDAENIPMSELTSALVDLENTGVYYVYAAKAADALTAASLFKKFGIQRLRAVDADYDAIKQTSIPVFKQRKQQNEKKFSNN
ncbi:MAG: hypothetical protein IPH78_10725 [Bacteroidetes bacterium]|nr:hypothetical protein [Bacteroidota bacterium]